MYNKLKELCDQLNNLTMDGLHNNNINALVILAVSANNDAFAFSKGDLPDILALLGSAISKIAKISNLSIEEILYIINDNETLLARHRKRKEGEED